MDKMTLMDSFVKKGGFYFSNWFLDATTPQMEEILFFHDATMMLVCYIAIVVLGGLVFIRKSVLFSVVFLEKKNVELFWTLGPIFVLVFLGFPSLLLLYRSSVGGISFNPSIFNSIKVIGHQWYWSYEYTLNKSILNYKSYLSDTQLNSFRNLEVDKPILVSGSCLTKFLITSDDVLHSFAVPSLGIKVDAVPGRMKELVTLPLVSGVFFGQCSELCGMNHSFMPIQVEVGNFNRK